ncbi:MAG: AraC family transcriptional regulator, partial [Anaerolineales bacterium]|nr:AraC family transcriptional regulator [Anaerolineales bacterium]
IFQKNAKPDREAQLRRLGMLSAASFDDFSSLRSFLPSEELSSLISHYWIIHWNIPEGVTYRPTEVLAAPMVNIFFMQAEAFLYGLTTQTFDYEAYGSGVMAGATFTPGGFYPFWGQSMVSLPPYKSDLQEVFPEATPEFSRQLLAKEDDEAIVMGIETLIRQKHIVESPYIKTIASIINAVNFDQKLRSVEEVSKHFGMSKRSLQLLFRREVGVSLKWVIMRARMLEAIEEAYKQPKPDWVRIAVDLGYSNQAHFITDFRRATGQSPAKYYKESEVN